MLNLSSSKAKALDIRPPYSKWDSSASSLGCSRELVRNAGSFISPHTCWIQIYSLVKTATWLEYSLKWADSQAIPPATFVALVLSVLLKGLPWWLIGKESTCQCRRLGFNLVGQEDLLEKEIATHSRILAWEIPWTEELVGYRLKTHKRVGHNWATKHRHHYITESTGWHK